MRTSKSILAGVAAGALGFGLLTFTAAPANATTFAIPMQFPSMTIVQGAADAQQIPFATQQNGTTGAITGTSVAVSLTNSSGASWVATDDTTKFNPVITGPTAGAGVITLNVGAAGTTFGQVPTGTYTMTLVLSSSATGVALAASTMSIGVVSNANAGTIAGSATFVDDTVWADASPVTSQIVATDDSINGSSRNQPYYVQYTNSAGGPIVAPLNMYAATAGLNGAGARISLDDSAVFLGEPGVVSFLRAAGVTGAAGQWQSTAGSGSVVATFAVPVNQVTGTLPVTIDSSAALSNLDITSAVSGSAAGITATPAADDSLIVPASGSVKFTVSGRTTVGGTATAGVPVTFTATPVNNTNGTGGVSYSSISPALGTTVTSGAGGVVALEYTVTNAVNARGVRITASYPNSAGATKTYFVAFALGGTPVNLLVPTANVTAANSGTLGLSAVVLDAFGQPVANNPVRATVSGVAANAAGTILTTNASGQVTYTITVPAGTVSGASSVATFNAWDGAAYAGGALQKQTTVTYTSGSAAVSTVAVRGSFAGNASSYTPLLADNKLNAATNPMYVNTAVNLAAAYTPAADGYAWKIQGTATNASAATIAGAPVTVTASAGGKVLDPTTDLWADSVTVYTDTNGQITAVLTSTKTGEISYTLTSGSASTTAKAHYSNRATDARTVAVTSSASSVAAGDGATITAEVTDRFGNPVSGVAVAFTEIGPGYIAGTGQATTTATGRAEATLVTVAGLNGTSAVTATVAGTQTVSMPGALPSAAAQTAVSRTGLTLQVGNAVNTVSTYNAWPPANDAAATTVSVTGVTAGQANAAVAIEVRGGASTKTIVIVGERTTVSGKPGIRIEGTASGFAAGDKVKPFVRFPGQTEYTVGSARPVVGTAGDFTWQRKTGKKTYVYFKSEDDVVKSNTVIIAAN